MRFSFNILLIIISVVSISFVSIIFYPSSPSGVIYVKVTERVAMQWDTGYGFNPAQKKELSPNCDLQKIDGYSLCRALEFRRWSMPSKIKFIFESRNEFPNAFVRYADAKKLKKINFDPKEGVAHLPTVQKHFLFSRFILFVIGILLITTLIYLVSLNIQNSFKIYYNKLGFNFLFIAIIPYLALAVFLWYIYPGFLNPFNPLDIIQNSEKYWLSFREGLVTQVFWSSLYEVIRSSFFILSFQAFSFLTALIFFWQKSFSKFSSKISFLVILCLIFNPVSLLYFGFLERSITNAYVFCVTILIIAFFQFERLDKKLKATVIISFCLILIMLRMDNIIFVLVFTFISYWRSSLTYLLISFVVLSFSWLYLSFGGGRGIIQNHESINYINLSLSDSIARLYAKPSARKLILQYPENKYFQKHLNFESFPKTAGSRFDIHKTYQNLEEPIPFLVNASSLIVKMPIHFLHVRLLALRVSIADVGQNIWDFSTLDPRLYDIGYYEDSSDTIGNKLGYQSNSMSFIVTSQHGLIFELFIFVMLFLGLIAIFWFPLTGKVSFLILIKLLAIGCVIPTIGGRYMYEILLATMALPMIFLCEKSKAKKNIN